ncbi:MAG: hypothetical protein LRY62_00020 [Alphaproteobacteria bacterium]|nr:hypothetical protein [Alphaproteobacteria bacterium]
MGMKGGAKLIVQREEFFDPPGAADGEFSPIRCLSALLEGQSSTTIQTIVAQFEDVLRNRPEAEIRNFLRKVTEEMRDMEEDLLTAFPYDEKMPELDQEVSEAGFNLLVGLSAVEDYEASLNSQTPKQPLTAFQEILDHLVPALHHSSRRMKYTKMPRRKVSRSGFRCCLP